MRLVLVDIGEEESEVLSIKSYRIVCVQHEGVTGCSSVSTATFRDVIVCATYATHAILRSRASAANVALRDIVANCFITLEGQVLRAERTLRNSNYHIELETQG
jgi:hypothetical protein